MQPKDWKTNDESFLTMLIEGIRSRGGTCLTRTAVAAANAFKDKRSASSVQNPEDRATLDRANRVLTTAAKADGNKLRKVGQMWTVSLSDVVSSTKKSKKPLLNSQTTLPEASPDITDVLKDAGYKVVEGADAVKAAIKTTGKAS